MEKISVAVFFLRACVQSSPRTASRYSRYSFQMISADLKQLLFSSYWSSQKHGFRRLSLFKSFGAVLCQQIFNQLQSFHVTFTTTQLQPLHLSIVARE